MPRRSTLAVLLLRILAGLGLCAALASLRIDAIGGDADTRRDHRCTVGQRDSSALARAARDSVGRRRGRSQRVTGYRRTRTGLVVRTENIDQGAFHDGGLVTYDCRGRITLIWLDGG